MTHDHAPDTDMVLVERSLIGAACHAIEKKRDAPNLLAKLRAVTMAAGRADAVPEGWTVDRNEDGEVRVIGPDGGMHPRADKGQQAERLLHSLATALIASAAVNQPMTTQGEAVVRDDYFSSLREAVLAFDENPNGQNSTAVIMRARRLTGPQS